MKLFERIEANVKGKDISVVFPEAKDPRILKAASRLKKDGLVKPVLIGNPKEVKAAAKEFGADIEGIEILDNKNYPLMDELVTSFVERRKGKIDEEGARKLLTENVNYFGTMLTYLNKVNAMISGAIHPTGDTVRPALQIVKTKPGISRVAGAFLMLGPNGEEYLFADCAINIAPNSQELAEIAIAGAKAAEAFMIDPKVAMLSFSTKGSADAEEAKKVEKALEIAKELCSDYPIDGEMQFDAALVPSVGKSKAPGSNVAGKANVFIFPSLEAGNIGYKIAQRLGKFEAIGPILLGLNKPISDLSRGCNEEDVYKLAVLTAAQSLID